MGCSLSYKQAGCQTASLNLLWNRRQAYHLAGVISERRAGLPSAGENFSTGQFFPTQIEGSPGVWAGVEAQSMALRK